MIFPTLLFFFLAVAHAMPPFNLNNILAVRNTPPAVDFHHRIPSPVRPTAVLASPSPECTVGAPATSTNAPNYPIDGFTKVLPRENETVSYGVEKEWDGEHYVSGHYVGGGHLSEPYAAFKCQYSCNNEDRCQAYFIQYVDVNTDDEHAQCTLYNALIHPEVLVAAPNTTIGGGGYDRLCK
ncbi:hypothetical protein QBC34DRAFT_475606 [Podospora aff. communis PSN243]|uniref:Apple domain-containing protein n=1 Tax=Podospora aff. communis PSN243 TaxID=3040156 RepID=A0AAV9H0Z7_9PEZI|nr:hypothetical protein QBC34DRAFT_475606 [Podospora aff. communis PSN243]